MAWPLSCILVLYSAMILSQSSSISSQNSGRFSVGQSLIAKSNDSSILSPSGDFAFGFHPLPDNDNTTTTTNNNNNNNDNNVFLLSIWYAKIPDTIVWYANEGNPVPQGSKLTITASEGLVLSDPQGTQLWNTTNDSSSGAAISYGFMNDTGNFVLKSSSSDTPLWETFKFPTDTLLPSQVWDAGKEINSRMSESNFTKGRFPLRLLPDGNLVLNTRDLATDFAYGSYYESGTNNPVDNVGKQAVYSESGDMYVVREDGSEFDLIIQPGTLVSTKDYYQRATLNYNGVLTWYSYPRASTLGSGVDWSEIQSEPDNICNRIASYGGDFDSGACGYNSICNIDDNQKPVCKCPPNYSLMDPNDMIGSCEPDFKLDVCENFEDGVKSNYEMIQLKNTNWPSGDYARLNTSSEEECKNSCLNDCFCAAVIFSGSGCWKKKPPLSNGRHGGWEPSTAWLKVGLSNATTDPNNPSIPPGAVKYKSSVVTTGILGGSVTINFILITAIVLIIFFKHKRKQSRGYKDPQRGSLLEHDRVHKFTYRKLESATNGFKEEIGRGSFGVVYKGTITTGVNSITVAVKKLDRTFMGADKEFTAEVNAIGLTHHKNLVRFIGYCKEKDKRLLVYEYMPNGTVADYLFGDSRPSWQARIHIAQGVARGLLYLHEECTTQIIHCDIKPQNILVDDHYNARISDFGLAKLLVLNQSQTNTAVRGTKGYVAPEWFKNKPVTMKVDVYSFGVLLLEIICCRRSVCMELSAGERAILTDWALDCYQYGMLDSLVNDDMEALNDRPTLERFIKVGLWCIQEDPNLRPTMHLVNQMLEGVAEVPNPPCSTSFSVTPFRGGLWTHCNFRAKNTEGPAGRRPVSQLFFAELFGDVDEYKVDSCVTLDGRGRCRDIVRGCEMCPKRVCHPVNGFKNGHPDEYTPL